MKSKSLSTWKIKVTLEQKAIHSTQRADLPVQNDLGQVPINIMVLVLREELQFEAGHQIQIHQGKIIKQYPAAKARQMADWYFVLIEN